MQKNLIDFNIGDEGIISESSDLCKCLNSVGINIGEKVMLERKAPFGDPFCIRVSDICLCISKKDAKRIILKVNNNI